MLRKRKLKEFCDAAYFEIGKFTVNTTITFNKDREFHYRYVRMTKERFDHLLSLVREKITKKDTRLREAITAEERLVITLRYLSSGMSQQDLCWNFRVGWTTVSNILSEVGIAILDVLSPIYVRPPSTENEWRYIADNFEELWDFPHCIGAIDGKHIPLVHDSFFF